MKKNAISPTCQQLHLLRKCLRMMRRTTAAELCSARSWTGVAAAFFASLERRSCINLSTADADEEGEEAKDRPLMLTKQLSFAADKLPVSTFSDPQCNLSKNVRVK